jgi:2'-5' RNA ligase
VPRLRLGVALLVPPPIAIEVDGLRRACGDGALGRIPAHLTLVPPVNVNQVDLPAALARLRAAAAAVDGPITVTLGPVATFHPASPVLYLAVEEEGGRAGDIQRLRDGVFQPPLERTLTWPFVPHVTLADEIDPARIPAALVAMVDYRAAVSFGEITLLREAQPGRVWVPIADARLGPPAVVARGGLPVELWWSTLADPEVAALLDADREVAPPLASESRSVPPDGEPFVVAARRDGLLLGAARGWRRGPRVEVVGLVVTEAAGLEDIERHLRAAVAASDPGG